MKTLQTFLIATLATLFSAVSALQTIAAEPITLVAFGDSLTAGHGLKISASFPAKLDKALKARGYNVVVHNAGVSGDTATSGLSRLAWSLPAKTQAIIVELGANDALRGVDPAQTLSALDGILKKLNARKIPILLTGMLAPPNMGAEYGKKFNKIFPTLAKKYQTIFYPFFLDGVAAKPLLNQPDGIHPNEKGVEIIVEKIMPMVETLLNNIKHP